MKLLTIIKDQAAHPAVQIDDHVLDLALAPNVMNLTTALPETLKGILAGGRSMLDRVAEIARQAAGQEWIDMLKTSGVLTPLDATALAPVIPDPAIFLSIGANSRGHVAEMVDKPPVAPESFFKIRSAIAASGDSIPLPADHSDMVDWEGELCAVVGERCHRVSVEEAGRYIVGYTLTNDVSARNNVRDFMAADNRKDVVGQLGLLIQLKNFPRFAPVGPAIATRDEFPDEWDYHLETRVNGAIVQQSTKADLIFSPEEILSYYSQYFVFEPGDIFSFGSPPGVGMAMKPPRFLNAGDQVEISLKEIGTLRNSFVAPV